MKRLFILLGVIFITGNAPPISKSQYNIPGGARTLCTTDIDNDLDIDIITGHNVAWGDTNKSISELENIDNGIFSVKDTSKSFCGYQENIFTINVNNDSFPDLVVFYSDFTYGTERYIRIYFNEQGNFNNYSNCDLECDATFSSINHGKINDDDYDDIVVASNNDQLWGILYNDGNGGFTTPVYYDVQGSHPTDLACGDLNGDELEDVVIGGFLLEVHYSCDTGFIRDSIDLNHSQVQITDIDNDNDNDLVSLSSFFSNTFVSIIENIDNQGFLVHESITYSPNCWRFIVSDLNNDTLPDLITSSVGNGIYLLYNDGNYQLSQPVFISVPLNGYDFVNASSGDLDNNGFNDLIITQTNVQFVNLYFNDGNGNFVENPITNIEIPSSKNQIPNLTCYPNPFTTELNINYDIKESSFVDISVFNLSGELIKVLTYKPQEGGNQQIKWDGIDNDGKSCNPGPYVLTIKVNGQFRQSIKLIKLK